MKLEDIGFYTLSDHRVKSNAHAVLNGSPMPLSRCELILTNRCNFKCPYCRGLRKDIDRELTCKEATDILCRWTSHDLKNVRFSGGEPTLVSYLPGLVSWAALGDVQRIAISTNGSAKLDLYKELIDRGVNDISISLDACCSSTGSIMSGAKGSVWERVVKNIEELSGMTYVTVGIVLTESNMHEAGKTIEFAKNLGVSDVRIIPAAQVDDKLSSLKLNEWNMDKPILNYRIQRAKEGKKVRGLSDTDSRRCFLSLDDMAVAGDYHFPCIIYMREKGDPIGKVGDGMRKDRKKWCSEHDCYNDPICRGNCLDVCAMYNNKFQDKLIELCNLEKLDSSLFDWSTWRKRNVSDLLKGTHLRFHNLEYVKDIIKRYAVGWAEGTELPCRPKAGHVGLMMFKDDEHFWFHLRKNEFVEIFSDWNKK